MDPVSSLKPSLSALELLRQGLQAGYDLEDIAEHYKEKIQEEAAAIMKNTQHKELKEQIQKDLHNLAVIDRNKFITPRNCPLFSDLSPRSLFPYVVPMYYLCIPYVFPMSLYLSFSDLSPRSFFP